MFLKVAPSQIVPYIRGGGSIDKVTTYINYVMVTDMVLEKIISIISI
jgi:hypothetical protein